MREIMFRGKNALTGEWHYGSLQVFKGFSIFDHNLKRWHVVRGETVGQHTGLKDVNGKPIFEGDVVGELHYRYGEPYRKEGYYKVFQVSMDYDRRGWYPFACGDGCGCCETDTIWPDGCDVIGNIHDNPELL